VKLNYNLVEI